MSQTYHYTFKAPITTTANDLASFLKGVGMKAAEMGFNPTLINIAFITPEQLQLARLITTGYWMADERLKGLVLDDVVWGHDPVHGSCRLIPEHGVILALDNDPEIVLGFLAYPMELRGMKGRIRIPTPCSDHWHYRSFVNSPDPRLRKLVALFAAAGYLEEEKDEFA